jgi:thiamine-phosphate pyrophosphorylase
MAAACRLYLITPPRLPDDFAATLAKALDAGDVAALQLRLKDQTLEGVQRAIEALLPVCQARDVALLLNDDPALAVRTGCDGAHVGQQDTSARDARRILGPDLMLGVTCHDSRHLAMEAGDAGADYVAFGAFFPTQTKQAPTQADPEILRWWSDLMEIPCVAIGGITVENCPSLIAAGADFLAVAGGVWAHPEGPAHAVRAFNQVFQAS